MTYSSRMTQAKYILFQARLIESHDRKIFLISDNLRVHHGKKVKAWAKERSEQIELYHIPSYSKELKENVLSFFRKLQKTPSRVAKYFRSPKVPYC